MGGREQAYCAAAAQKFLFQSEVGLMYPLHAAPDECGCGIRNADGDKRETKQHREHQGQIEQPGNNEIDHGKPLFSAILFFLLKKQLACQRTRISRNISYPAEIKCNFIRLTSSCTTLRSGRHLIMIEKSARS
jgi:hypothetical protein